MKFRLFAIAALALILGACKTTSNTKTTDSNSEEVRAGAASGKAVLVKEVSLKDRALNRWNLIIAGDFARAYDYLSPGYRSTRERQDYVTVMNQRPIRWSKANVFDEACESADACTVKVQLDFQIEMPVAGVGKVDSLSVVDEKWLRVDGSWYMLPTKN
jgi:hypothetical protein